MIFRIQIKFFHIPVVLLMMGMFFSCVNDLDSIKKITYKPSDPDERTFDLEMIYTDSGFAKIHLFAKIAETYSNPEPVIKFKDGVKINFFSEDGEIISVLTSLYGEIKQDKGLIFVRDSVELYNIEKNQRLLTEELHWRQKDSVIYTDKAAVVKTEDAVFFGDGLKTKQDFSTYDFLKPTGKVDLSKRK